MFDIFLNSQIAAFPVAFLAMFVAGAKLYRVTRQKSAAAFSIGMACLLISQVVLFGAYYLWPVVYEKATGIAPSKAHDIVFFVSTGFNVLGLVIASIGLLFFAWAGAKAQPTVQHDGASSPGVTRD